MSGAVFALFLVFLLLQRVKAEPLEPLRELVEATEHAAVRLKAWCSDALVLHTAHCGAQVTPCLPERE